MTKSRLDGLYFVLLGTAVFLLLGIALASRADHPNSDYRFVYNSARCLFRNVDPYQQSEFIRVFKADGGDLGSRDLRKQYLEMSHHMYLPTSFIVAPFAMFSWGTSIVLWTSLIVVSYILAALLMWDLGSHHSPVLSGLLVGLILGTSELILITGNAAGLVVSFCVIAVWCFIQERWVWAGVVLLAIALMLKPHDAGFIWFYFLLAGGNFRRRALQTLVLTIVLGVPTVLWVTHVAPNWLPELRGNLALLSAQGHLNDPGPSSLAGHGIAMIIDLQAILSVLRDDPSIYNPASYLIFGVPLIIWSTVTVKNRPTQIRAWIAIASISALSLLPVYHRLCDSKLLLLTIPACSILWAEGGLIARIAITVNTAAIFLTGEIQWALFFAVLKHILTLAPWLSGKLLILIQVLPVPCALLAVGCFYLWAYVRRTKEKLPQSGDALEVG